MLLGLPQDNNSSYLTGPAMAPARIREAIFCDFSNLSTETGFDLNDTALWRDAGDVPLEGRHGRDAFEAIHGGVSTLISDKHRVLSLGGDHSVSFPAISAHADAYPGLSILHIDAHPDLYHDMQNNPFSHASPFARVMESKQVNRLVQVGIRTCNPHQRAQAEKFGVEMHEMRDLSGLAELAFEGPIYLSLDLDGLDLAFAPGVSHYEPGGLSTRQVLDIIHTVPGQFVDADLVELNPHRNPQGLTATVAAKLCKEIVGRLLVS